MGSAPCAVQLKDIEDGPRCQVFSDKATDVLALAIGDIKSRHPQLRAQAKHLLVESRYGERRSGGHVGHKAGVCVQVVQEALIVV